MKILWLYKYASDYNFDHFLHMDIAEFMSNFGDIELKCYGPGLHISNPKTCLVPYESGRLLEELHRRFPFDVIVMCTKSRMFMNYLPIYAFDNKRGEIAEGEWLPRDFMSFSKGKRVVFEEDYHYEKDDTWYQSRGVSLICQRHYCNVERGNAMPQGIKHVFLPFSIDPQVFNDRGQSRTNVMKFVGSENTKYYIDRHKAVDMLVQAKLLRYERYNDEAYINDLNRFTCHLSGQSFYYILPAKVFEITACGSVLFTNNNPKSGLDKVFSPNSYVKWEDDFSDIIDKARWILNDTEAQKRITKSAKLEIISRHTHGIRTREFLEMLQHA